MAVPYEDEGEATTASEDDLMDGTYGFSTPPTRSYMKSAGCRRGGRLSKGAFDVLAQTGGNSDAKKRGIGGKGAPGAVPRHRSEKRYGKRAKSREVERHQARAFKELDTTMEVLGIAEVMGEVNLGGGDPQGSLASPELGSLGSTLSLASLGSSTPRPASAAGPSPAGTPLPRAPASSASAAAVDAVLTGAAGSVRRSISDGSFRMSALHVPVSVSPLAASEPLVSARLQSRNAASTSGQVNQQPPIPIYHTLSAPSLAVAPQPPFSAAASGSISTAAIATASNRCGGPSSSAAVHHRRQSTGAPLPARERLVADRKQFQEHIHSVLDGSLNDDGLAEKLREGLGKAEDLQMQLILLQTPPGESWTEVDNKLAWLEDCHRRARDILRELKPHKPQLMSDEYLRTSYDALVDRLVPELVHLMQMCSTAIGEMVQRGLGASEEGIKAALRCAKRAVDVSLQINCKIKEEVPGDLQQLLMDQLALAAGSAAAALIEASRQMAEGLLVPSSLRPGLFAHEVGNKVKLLTASWRGCADLVCRVNKHWESQRFVLQCQLCSAYLQAAEAAVTMQEHGERVGKVDEESPLSSSGSGTWGISSVWGAPTAGRRRLGGGSGSETMEARHAGDDEVQAQAWVPGLLLNLLNRAQDAHRKLREDLLRCEDAATAAADGRSASPDADVAHSEVYDVLDSLQEAFSQLALSNTRRTAELCGGGPELLACWALEICKDQAEQALRLVQQYDQGSLGMGDLLSCPPEGMEYEEVEKGVALFNALKRSTTAVVNALLRVKNLLKIRRADEGIPELPSARRAPGKAVPPRNPFLPVASSAVTAALRNVAPDRTRHVPLPRQGAALQPGGRGRHLPQELAARPPPLQLSAQFLPGTRAVRCCVASNTPPDRGAHSDVSSCDVPPAAAIPTLAAPGASASNSNSPPLIRSFKSILTSQRPALASPAAPTDIQQSGAALGSDTACRVSALSAEIRGLGAGKSLQAAHSHPHRDQRHHYHRAAMSRGGSTHIGRGGRTAALAGRVSRGRRGNYAHEAMHTDVTATLEQQGMAAGGGWQDSQAEVAPDSWSPQQQPDLLPPTPPTRQGRTPPPADLLQATSRASGAPSAHHLVPPASLPKANVHQQQAQNQQASDTSAWQGRQHNHAATAQCPGTCPAPPAVTAADSTPLAAAQVAVGHVVALAAGLNSKAPMASAHIAANAQQAAGSCSRHAPALVARAGMARAALVADLAPSSLPSFTANSMPDTAATKQRAAEQAAVANNQPSHSLGLLPRPAVSSALRTPEPEGWQVVGSPVHGVSAGAICKWAAPCSAISAAARGQTTLAAALPAAVPSSPARASAALAVAPAPGAAITSPPAAPSHPSPSPFQLWSSFAAAASSSSKGSAALIAELAAAAPPASVASQTSPPLPALPVPDDPVAAARPTPEAVQEGHAAAADGAACSVPQPAQQLSASQPVSRPGSSVTDGGRAAPALALDRPAGAEGSAQGRSLYHSPQPGASPNDSGADETSNPWRVAGRGGMPGRLSKSRTASGAAPPLPPPQQPMPHLPHQQPQQPQQLPRPVCASPFARPTAQAMRAAAASSPPGHGMTDAVARSPVPVPMSAFQGFSVQQAVARSNAEAGSSSQQSCNRPAPPCASAPDVAPRTAPQEPQLSRHLSANGAPRWPIADGPPRPPTTHGVPTAFPTAQPRYLAEHELPAAAAVAASLPTCQAVGAGANAGANGLPERPVALNAGLRVPTMTAVAAAANGLPSPPAVGSTGSTAVSSVAGGDIDCYWSIRWEDLKNGLITQLGSGSYGEVYHGQYHYADVAIKVIKIDRASEADQEEAIKRFWSEVGFQRRLSHHPNVVRFIGACCELTGPSDAAVATAAPRKPMLAIVMEHCRLGNVFKMIAQARKVSRQLQEGVPQDRGAERRYPHQFYTSWLRRLEVAAGAAAGVEYMHDKGCVHRDLTSYNLLLDWGQPPAWVVKVCDFNLSRMVTDSAADSAAPASPNSPAWMAPEMLAGRSFGREADVFSYGVVLYEIVTLREPWRHDEADRPLPAPAIITCVTRGQRLDVPTLEELRPPLPEGQPLLDLMRACWAQAPEERPSMRQVAITLQGILASVRRRVTHELRERARQGDAAGRG